MDERIGLLGVIAAIISMLLTSAPLAQEPTGQCAALLGQQIAAIPFAQPRVTAHIPVVECLLADPVIRTYVGLAENAWDFNDPHAMAGFGPISPTAPSSQQAGVTN